MEILNRFIEKLKCCWFILTSRNHYVLTIKNASEAMWYDETDDCLRPVIRKMKLYVDLQDDEIYNKDKKYLGTFEDFVISTINDFNDVKLESGWYPAKD